MFYRATFDLAEVSSQADVHPGTGVSAPRAPPLMPDDFESLQRVSWQGEQGTPDLKNPLLEPAMPWASGGIMAHGTVLHDPIGGLGRVRQVSTSAEKRLEGLSARQVSQRRLIYLENPEGIVPRRARLLLVSWPDRRRVHLTWKAGADAAGRSEQEPFHPEAGDSRRVSVDVR
jgi:hypothetical protein